ncbi:zinc phosphodiesterase ELAC protein 1-like [Argonauta hians]
MSLKVIFLGTGAAYPSPHRGASCLVLQNDGDSWVFDCGEGSQIQLMKSCVKPGKISKIFISHLHGDHLFGLPGLLCTISMNNARKKPVEIYGPEGLCKYIRTCLSLSRSLLDFNITIYELQVLGNQQAEDFKDWVVDHSSLSEKPLPNEDPNSLICPDSNQIWNIFENETCFVKAVSLKHRIPSFAFVVEEKPLPGKLNAPLLSSKGIPPGPLYKELKSGTTVTSPSGEMIYPEDVLGPPIKGRKIVIAGDSCDSTELLKIGKNCQLFIHEATLCDSMFEQAFENGHSTPSQVGQLALELGAQHLILTHFSQRYQGLSAEESIPNKNSGKDKVSLTVILDDILKAVGDNSIKVELAEDFKIIDIKRRLN